MNIFNNLKGLQESQKVKKVEKYHKGKRISVGVLILANSGKPLLEVYPVAKKQYSVTRWDEAGNQLYTNTLNGRECIKLIKVLSEPEV